MPQDPLIDKLVARHAELKAHVDKFYEVIKEFQDLEATIGNLRRLFPDLFKDVDFGTVAAPAEAKVLSVTEPPLLRIPTQPKPTLAVLAQDILQSQEKLHASELLALLREKGWLGSGNVQKDIRNIASTLGLKRDVFKNYGNNTWGLLSRFEEGDMMN
jgi:hypothetical protein